MNLAKDAKPEARNELAGDKWLITVGYKSEFSFKIVNRSSTSSREPSRFKGKPNIAIFVNGRVHEAILYLAKVQTNRRLNIAQHRYRSYKNRVINLHLMKV